MGLFDDVVKNDETLNPGIEGKNLLGLFLKSAVHSIPEVFGVRPPLDVQQYRAENPVMGFGSEMLGMAVPYGGWMKAAGKIPTIVKWADRVSDIEKPVASAFKREMIRWTPFEGARVASTTLFGDMDVSEVALSAALDLGLIGGFGAGIAALKGAKPILSPEVTLGAQVQKVLPDFDLSLPLQTKLEKVRSMLPGVNEPSFKALLEKYDQTLSREIRNEDIDYTLLGKKNAAGRPVAAYVRALEDGKPGEINRLFKVRRDGLTKDKDGNPVPYPMAVKRPVVNPNLEFADEASWRQVMRDFGVPEDFEHSGQYWRVMELRKDKLAEGVGKTITRNLKSIGDDWYLGSEGPNGMYVMAKRIPSRYTPTNFDVLADKQRGLPEAAMKKVQQTAGGGVVASVVEPIGDIIWRMSEAFTHQKGAAVLSKIDEALRLLSNKQVPFVEEHAQNLARNKVDPKLVNEALAAYGKAHEKLPVINDMHKRAVEITSAVGRQDWETARKKLLELREIAADPVRLEKELSKGWKPPSIYNAGDKWLLFKTETPGRFVPEREAWARAMDKRLAYDPWAKLDDAKVRQGAQSIYLNTSDKFRNEVALFGGGLGTPAATSPAVKGLLKAGEKLGISPQARDIGEGMRTAVRAIKQYVGPAAHQFSHSPVGRYIYLQAKMLADFAETRANNIAFGEVAFSGKRSIFKSMAGTPELKGGIVGDVDKLSEAAWVEVRDAQLNNTPLEKIVNPEAKKYLTRLTKADADGLKELNAVATYTSNPELKALPHHYMMTRTWLGDWRAPVYTEGGKLVYMASGRTPGIAEKIANEFIKNGDSMGVKLRRADLKEKRLFQSSKEEDMDWAKQMTIGQKKVKEITDLTRRTMTKPGFFQERENIGGFIGGEKPMTRQEFKEILKSHIDRTQRYTAEMVANHDLKPYMKMLQETQPELIQHMGKRLNDIFRKQGPFSTAINKGADKLLAPFIGKDSATKIASAANNLLYHWQFGSGNLTFPIMNALTFVQTVLPEVAFVVGAAPLSKSRYYSIFPLMNGKGQTKNSVSVLDMLKLQRQVFRELGTPDEQLFEAYKRAVNAGTVDPRMIEEFIGQNSRLATDFKKALSSPGDFGKAVGAASSYLPGISEKFSRGHAFTTGYIVGRDMMNLQGERLYQFATEFTNRTMYQYTAAAKPRFMTGPVGSTFGLFKNWAFHYLGNMMVYADQGIRYNHWSPFLWSMGGTAGIAGVGGVPGYFAADAISRLMSDKTLMQNIYQGFGSEDPRNGGTSIADIIYYGLPAFLNTSLQASAGAPGADIMQTVGLLTSSVWFDRAKAAGRFTENAWDNWKITGENPLKNPAIRDQFMRAFSPRSLYRAVAVSQEDTLRSLMTGNPVATDLKWNERLVYAMGLNPLYIEKTQTVANELWKDQEKMRTAVAQMGAAWANAIESGDDYALDVLTRRIFAQGIDFGSVIKSAQARMQKRAEPTIERQFEPRNVQKRSEGILP